MNNNIKSDKEYRECMSEIESNREKIHEEFRQRNIERQRFRKELNECFIWSKRCTDIMFHFAEYLPREVFYDFMMSTEITAYLPIEIGEIIKKRRELGIYDISLIYG